MGGLLRPVPVQDKGSREYPGATRERCSWCYIRLRGSAGRPDSKLRIQNTISKTLPSAVPDGSLGFWPPILCACQRTSRHVWALRVRASFGFSTSSFAFLMQDTMWLCTAMAPKVAGECLSSNGRILFTGTGSRLHDTGLPLLYKSSLLCTLWHFDIVYVH